MIAFWHRYFGPCGRLRMAWYILKGRTVVYRVVIRDGGLDLRGIGKCIISEVQVFGADIGIRTNYTTPNVIVFEPEQHVSGLSYQDQTGETES